MSCFFLGKFQYFGKCAGVKHWTNILSAMAESAMAMDPFIHTVILYQEGDMYFAPSTLQCLAFIAKLCK